MNIKNENKEKKQKPGTINVTLKVFTESILAYSDHDQELLRWLWSYTFEELHGSKSKLIQALNSDWLNIHRAFTGRLQPITPLIKKIQQLKDSVFNPIKLVDTVVTRQVHLALDYARDIKSMVVITGPTGRGKTLSAQHWANANNHGQSKYIRVPSNSTRTTLVQEICRSSGIGINCTRTSVLEARLRDAFTRNNVIIVDEAGHLMPRAGSSSAAIEFLRDLHDMCGCSVALIFTDVYLQDMKTGRLADYFEQFIGRIKFEVKIPKEVSKAEIKSVIEAYCPEPPNKLLTFALNTARNGDGKLRTLFEDLDRAQKWAESQGFSEVKYDDLKMAIDWRKSGGLWPE